MIALTWQTVLILMLAYLAGCIVGCLARKLKGASPAVSASGNDLAFVASGAVAVVPVAVPPVVVTMPKTPRSVQNAFRRADRDAPTDAVAAEPPAPPSPPQAEAQPARARPVPLVKAPESAEAAVAAALATPPAPAAPARDDLTRIRAIDGALAEKLNAAGVTRYSQIAAWTSEQVKAMSQQLGFTGRIERENWIEQAHILARGEETQYATRLAIAAMMPPPAAPEPATTSPDVSSRAAFAEPRRAMPSPAPAPAAPTPVVAAAPAPADAGRDRLQRIGGISAEVENTLNSHGIARYSQIAGWQRDDVERVERLLGVSARVSRENWIEQAQILANGGATAYSREFDRRGGPPAPASATAPPPDLSGMVSVRSEAFRASDSLAVRPAKARDDLKRIRGIGVALETKLGALGVSNYEQIANWTAADVAAVSSKLGLDRTIERENWIEQAQILARGGVTAYARALDRGPAPAAMPTPAPAELAAPQPVATAPAALVPVTPAATVPPSLSGMRSVRSEAYRGEDSLAASPRAAAPDDLKRIRGIGLLIERKLNAMGVESYEQIANWTADDVATVNAKLEFKGRIERENWIEQARILASGGHTDFSKRFERGEV